MEPHIAAEIEDNDVFKPKEVDDEWTRYLHALVTAPGMDMLPGTTKLNLDMSKHKRSLSKRGSISRRKKPSREAIFRLGSSEDSIYIDSTEPRQTIFPVTNETDENQEQTTKKREADISTDDTPLRPPKVAGGVKIPGLLGDLMGSKLFNKKRNEIALNSPTSEDPVPPSLSLSTSTDEAPIGEPAPPNPRPEPETLPENIPDAHDKPTIGAITETDEEVVNTANDPGVSPSSNMPPVLPSVEDVDSRPCQENLEPEVTDMPEVNQDAMLQSSRNTALEDSDNITKEQEPACEVSAAVKTSTEASTKSEPALHESTLSILTGVRHRKMESSPGESTGSPEAGSSAAASVADQQVSSLKDELLTWILRLLVVAVISTYIVLIFFKRT